MDINLKNLQDEDVVNLHLVGEIKLDSLDINKITPHFLLHLLQIQKFLILRKRSSAVFRI